MIITRVEFNRKAATQGATSRYTGNYEWRTCQGPKAAAKVGPVLHLWPCGRKAPNLPLSHHAPIY